MTTCNHFLAYECFRVRVEHFMERLKQAKLSVPSGSALGTGSCPSCGETVSARIPFGNTQIVLMICSSDGCKNQVEHWQGEIEPDKLCPPCDRKRRDQDALLHEALLQAGYDA